MLSAFQIPGTSALSFFPFPLSREAPHFNHVFASLVDAFPELTLPFFLERMRRPRSGFFLFRFPFFPLSPLKLPRKWAETLYPAEAPSRAELLVLFLSPPISRRRTGLGFRILNPWKTKRFKPLYCTLGVFFLNLSYPSPFYMHQPPPYQVVRHEVFYSLSVVVVGFSASDTGFMA